MGSTPIPIFEERLSPFLFHDNQLTVDAITFDSIKSLGNVLHIANEGNLDPWAREAESLFLTSNHYLRNENSWYIHAPPQFYRTYYSAFRKQLAMQTRNTRNLTHELYIPDSKAGDAENMHARRFVAPLWQSAHGRRYCVTARGDVALVPRYAKVADEICL
jgi:hypothetical protein